MPFVQANGIAVHYRLAGTRGAPRIAFLNSLGSDLHIWDAVADRLGREFELLFADKRGHGLSQSSPAPYSLDLLASDALALLDTLGWKTASLVGISVGGLVAQHIAIQAPERVEALVLLDTAARIGTVGSWSERIAAVEAGGVGAISEAVARRWFTEGFPQAQPAAYIGWRTMLERTSDAGYAGTCMALRDADLTQHVGRIKAPTLALAGDADLATTPDLVRATAELIAGAKFALVAGAGHLPCLEQPAEVALLIGDHVRHSVQQRAGGKADGRLEAGMRVRRSVLGDAHVDRASAAITAFDADFQTFITEGAWGSVWSRPHFTLRERSIVTLALLAALGHDEEVAMHVRATRNTGATPDDLREAMLHVAVYAGVPAANRAIKIVKRTLAEMNAAAVTNEKEQAE